MILLILLPLLQPTFWLAGVSLRLPQPGISWSLVMTWFSITRFRNGCWTSSGKCGPRNTSAVCHQVVRVEWKGTSRLGQWWWSEKTILPDYCGPWELWPRCILVGMVSSEQCPSGLLGEPLSGLSSGFMILRSWITPLSPPSTVQLKPAALRTVLVRVSMLRKILVLLTLTNLTNQAFRSGLSRLHVRGVAVSSSLRSPLSCNCNLETYCCVVISRNGRWIKMSWLDPV